MTEIAAGIEAIAHPLLQGLGVGEAAIGLTLPDRRAVQSNLEHATRPRRKGDLAEVGPEGG